MYVGHRWELEGFYRHSGMFVCLYVCLSVCKYVNLYVCLYVMVGTWGLLSVRLYVCMHCISSTLSVSLSMYLISIYIDKPCNEGDRTRATAEGYQRYYLSSSMVSGIVSCYWLGIRQWKINWCTFAMMIILTHSADFNYWLKFAPKWKDF